VVPFLQVAAVSSINLGIAGACSRGGHFRRPCEEINGLRIHAICDSNAEALAATAEKLGAAESYTSFEQMLSKSELDAVIIATPMQFHAEQVIAALEAGLHVLSEVPAAVSIEECQSIVAAARRSRGHYMMAENYIYMRPNLIVQALAEAGLFGDLYYAEGEYLHELKGINIPGGWRRRYQTGIRGVTYGTHSLGPILKWMRGDRVVAVCCAGAGSGHHDAAGKPFENDASSVMLCKTARAGLIKIRVDMLSDRPHATTNYQLQGRNGAYEPHARQGKSIVSGSGVTAAISYGRNWMISRRSFFRIAGSSSRKRTGRGMAPATSFR